MSQSQTSQAIPIFLRRLTDVARMSKRRRNQLNRLGYAEKAGHMTLLRGSNGEALEVEALVAPEEPWGLAKMATELPVGRYELKAVGWRPSSAFKEETLLGLALHGYTYKTYEEPKPRATFLWPDDADATQKAMETSHYLNEGRDLINTPANLMTTEALEVAALRAAHEMGTQVHIIRDVDLVTHDFPLIYAVGRASVHAPRLVDIRFGQSTGPRVTLIGKGICFDTGGLNIKPSNSMLLMKKDMGGAAAALTLARLLHHRGVPLQGRLLLPIAENSIAGNAFRPSDVIKSRKGLSVEIGDTDAEGRLVLADALAYADEESPDVLITLATLTGAARVAVGPDVVPFYTRHEKEAARLKDISLTMQDPMWPLPLWDPYKAWLKSKVADLSSTGTGGFAGSVTAALFLEAFVEKAGMYLHADMYGWNQRARDGRPEGGEVQTVRALAAWLEQKAHLMAKATA